MSETKTTPAGVSDAAASSAARVLHRATAHLSPHVSREEAEALAEIDFLVLEYASDEGWADQMTDGAVHLGTTVAGYVRRWAVLCGYVGEREDAERRALLLALYDAVDRPKGVVPDTALPMWEDALRIAQAQGR